MYTEKVKFEFKENVSHSERLKFMSELFEELEKIEFEEKKIETGGIYNYQIKENGVVSMSSCFPISTNIIRNHIKIKKKESIIK